MAFISEYGNVITEYRNVISEYLYTVVRLGQAKQTD